MRPTETILAAVALCAAASVFGATDAVARVCQSGCKGELKGCFEAATADKIECRLACRSEEASGDVGGCLRSCRQAYRGERQGCRSDTSTCMTGCSGAVAAAASPACQGECGIALGECARDAAGDRPGCIAGCPTGPDRRACVQSCVDMSSDGIDACLAEAAACRAACEGAATTTSTAVSSTTSTTLVGAFCGDGVVNQASEECDGEDLGGATCPGSPLGAFPVCLGDCTLDFGPCEGGTTSTTLATTTTTSSSSSTSLATTTTSSSTSTTVGPFCGDGVVNQESEDCDGEDLGGATCPGSPTGAFPVCLGDCTLDFSPCEGGTTTTSSTLATTTSSTLVTTSTTLPPATTTSSSTSTSSSSSSTTLGSTTSTSTSTSSTTSTAPAIEGVLAFTTGAAGGVCGEIRNGGASGTILRTLTCGGLNVGGGCSQEGGSCGVAEGPTPANATTNFNASCDGSICMITARTAAETGSNNDCSAVGCQFGTWLPIANGGTSTCVLNTFASPGSGLLDLTSGNFEGSVPLTSAVTLTGNGAAPCPLCLVGGVPGQGSGVCSSVAANPGASCVGINATGDNYECLPSGVPLTPFGVDLTPIRTGTAFMDTTTDQDQVPGGVAGAFCPGQDTTEPGSLGCFSTGKMAPAGIEPLCDYIEERGSPAAGLAVDGGPVAGTLASVFCIPAAGNGVIDGAADLPGPGATTLPGTLELSTL